NEIGGGADSAGVFVAASRADLIRTGLGSRQQRCVDETVFQGSLIAFLVKVDTQCLMDAAGNLITADSERPDEEMDDSRAGDGRGGEGQIAPVQNDGRADERIVLASVEESRLNLHSQTGGFERRLERGGEPEFGARRSGGEVFIGNAEEALVRAHTQARVPDL